MKKTILLLTMVLFHSQLKAQSNSQITEVSVSSQPKLSNEYSSSYSNNLALREERKVGVGVGVGGALGLMGLNLELNMEDENAALMGFGYGDGYNTVHLQWKHSFEGQYLTPYFTAGYSRWNGTSDRNLRDSSYVIRSILNDDDLQKGSFSADFLIGSAGLQYNELAGDWVGASFYFEFNLLGSLNKSVLVPSGSVGAIYYF